MIRFARILCVIGVFCGCESKAKVLLMCCSGDSCNAFELVKVDPPEVEVVVRTTPAIMFAWSCQSVLSVNVSMSCDGVESAFRCIILSRLFFLGPPRS
jgi:hypothetical protein